MTLLARRLSIDLQDLIDHRRYTPSFGAGRDSGARFDGGIADSNACLIARRWIPCRFANSRIDNSSRA